MHLGTVTACDPKAPAPAMGYVALIRSPSITPETQTHSSGTQTMPSPVATEGYKGFFLSLYFQPKATNKTSVVGKGDKR